GLGGDLRALALIHLGSAELGAGQLDQAERHLEQGVALARLTGRPYLEFTGLAYQAGIDPRTAWPWPGPERRRLAGPPGGSFRSLGGTLERGIRAVELAQGHGWGDDPAAGFASLRVATVLIFKGRFEEAEPWIQRAERVLRADAEPAEG